MPVYDLGYRPWNPPRHPSWRQGWVIATLGIRLAWKSRWLRRLLTLAWLPAVYAGLAIFALEKAIEYPQWRRPLRGIVQIMPQLSWLTTPFQGVWGQDLNELRYRAWSQMLFWFYRYPQGVIMILVVGMIVPPLISADLRSRAHLLYFSRPLSLYGYLLGRAATVICYLSLITLLPALALYGLGVMLSSSLSVLHSTWDLPLRIGLASVVLMLPTAALAMFISSLCHENRKAMFAWFAVWVLGWVVYANVAVAETATEAPIQHEWPGFISLYHLLGSVQAWIFGLEGTDSILVGKAVLLGLLTIACTMGTALRISAPLRV